MNAQNFGCIHIVVDCICVVIFISVIVDRTLVIISIPLFFCISKLYERPIKTEMNIWEIIKSVEAKMKMIELQNFL